MSPVLLQVGPAGARRDHAAAPTLLADLFFRNADRTLSRNYIMETIWRTTAALATAAARHWRSSHQK